MSLGLAAVLEIHSSSQACCNNKAMRLLQHAIKQRPSCRVNSIFTTGQQVSTRDLEVRISAEAALACSNRHGQCQLQDWRLCCIQHLLNHGEIITLFSISLTSLSWKDQPGEVTCLNLRVAASCPVCGYISWLLALLICMARVTTH